MVTRILYASLLRLSQTSTDVAVCANDDNLWKEVLQHQFDVVGQHGEQKALVKRLHLGASDGWEGICLDLYTNHWKPYPLIIEGAEVVTGGNFQESAPYETYYVN